MRSPRARHASPLRLNIDPFLRRQDNRKRGPLAEGALYEDLPAVLPYDPLRYRQPEADPGLFGGEIGLEDLRGVLGRYSLSLVGEGETERLRLRVVGGPQGDTSPLR